MFICDTSGYIVREEGKANAKEEGKEAQRKWKGGGKWKQRWRKRRGNEGKGSRIAGENQQELGREKSEGGRK